MSNAPQYCLRKHCWEFADNELLLNDIDNKRHTGAISKLNTSPSLNFFNF